MALYSKEKINPVGSCGFLLIQMPILIVVYNIIRSIQTPANEYYLYSFLGDFSLTGINFDFY
jgi:membrane protein insertase Oxa1/YidC/SpoIIIJ